MRRNLLVWVVMIVLLASTGAYAMRLHTSGEVGVDLRYAYDPNEMAQCHATDPNDAGCYTLTAQGYLNLTVSVLPITVGRGTIDLGVAAEIKDRKGLFSSDDVFFTPGQNLTLSVTNFAWRSSGALWKNGPEATAVIGRARPNWSDWVMSSWTRHPAQDDVTIPHSLYGVEVSGIEVGPFVVDVFQGWGQLPDVSKAARISTSLGPADLTGVIISHEDQNNAAVRVVDYAVEGHVDVISGLGVTGTIARDGQSDTSAYEIGVDSDLIPGIKLSGTVWHTPLGFAPRYARWVNDPGQFDFEHRDYLRFDQHSSIGSKVAAGFLVGGVEFNAGFSRENRDLPGAQDKTKTELSGSTTLGRFDLGFTSTKVKDRDVNQTSNTTKLSVGTTWHGWSFLYTGTIEGTGSIDVENRVVSTKDELAISTSFDTFFADNMNLSLKMALVKPDQLAERVVQREIDLTWAAPIGLNLGLHYADYPRGKDHGKYRFEPTKAPGLYATAGMELKF